MANMKNFKGIESTILGYSVKSPIGISSIGRQAMINLEGECATARAAKDLGLMFV